MKIREVFTSNQVFLSEDNRFFSYKLLSSKTAKNEAGLSEAIAEKKCLCKPYSPKLKTKYLEIYEIEKNIVGPEIILIKIDEDSQRSVVRNVIKSIWTDNKIVLLNETDFAYCQRGRTNRVKEISKASADEIAHYPLQLDGYLCEFVLDSGGEEYWHIIALKDGNYEEITTSMVGNGFYISSLRPEPPIITFDQSYKLCTSYVGGSVKMSVGQIVDGKFIKMGAAQELQYWQDVYDGKEVSSWLSGEVENFSEFEKLM